MKTRALFAVGIAIIISACSTTKRLSEDIKYFNEDGARVSKAVFENDRIANGLITVKGDSANDRKLVARNKMGTLSDRKGLQRILEESLDITLDSTKPIVIIYHPGKDICNSTGTTDRYWIRNWYNWLEEGLIQVVDVEPIYIYKEPSGLKKYDGILDFKKDPDSIVERLFFEYHYACSSFVVISKNGDFLSVFGEFMPETVWKAAEIMRDK